jgi:hypothetical protein
VSRGRLGEAVAVILALGVAAVMVLAAVDAFRQHGRVAPQEADLLLGLTGVAVGAVAVYLGQRGNGH